MGNKPISVGLNTDKNHYKAGDVISGRVYLGVNKQPQQAITLQLQILGEEYCVVHHTTNHSENDANGQARTREENHYEEQRHTILRMEYPLHIFQNEQIPIGQYEYPFQVHLPANLPSSFSVSRGQSRAEVTYQIVATVVKPSSSLFSPNPSSTRKLEIFGVPASLPEANFLNMPMERIPINNCCWCRNKGRMEMETSIQPIVAQPMGNLNVGFKCQNRSTLGVLNVRVRLQQVVEWKVNGYSQSLTQILSKQELDPDQYPELKKLERMPHSYFGASSDAVLLNHEWRHTNIKIPRDTYDSYDGCNLQIRHLLSVTLNTNGCCSTNPEQTALVKIYRNAPKPQPLATPSAPPSEYDIESNNPPVEASAPSEVFDVQTFPDATPIYTDSPLAEAEALPADWNPSTAEVVDIPMAQAFVIGPVVTGHKPV